jgi:prevent-host-death family protein
MGKNSRHPRRKAASAEEWVAAADFKATCLQLMERVRESRAEYVVTKHGTPVARLVPYDAPDEQPRKFLGSMKGTVLHFARPTDALDESWDVNRDPDQPER